MTYAEEIIAMCLGLRGVCLAGAALLCVTGIAEKIADAREG